jgi:hypothetical protein
MVPVAILAQVPGPVRWQQTDLFFGESTEPLALSALPESVTEWAKAHLSCISKLLKTE